MRISDWSSDVCSSDLLGKVVAALAIVIAELALDRLQLFVEIIFALTFFHLALHAAANLLFDLQHTKLALHESEDHFEPLRRRILDEQSLLVRDLDVEIARDRIRSEEHTSELQSLMRISYAVFCLKKKNQLKHHLQHTTSTNKHRLKIPYETS